MWIPWSGYPWYFMFVSIIPTWQSWLSSHPGSEEIYLNSTNLIVFASHLEIQPSQFYCKNIHKNLKHLFFRFRHHYWHRTPHAHQIFFKCSSLSTALGTALLIGAAKHNFCKVRCGCGASRNTGGTISISNNYKNSKFSLFSKFTSKISNFFRSNSWRIASAAASSTEKSTRVNTTKIKLN